MIAFLRILIVCLLAVSAAQATSKNITIFTSLDSTFIGKQEEGIHVRNDSAKNPFGNIYGVSIGASYRLENSNIFITGKTNRLLQIPITQRGRLYDNDIFIKDVTTQSMLQTDIISAGYLIKNVMPFIFISNATFDTQIMSDTVTSRSKTSIYYGMGVNIWVNPKTSFSVALIAPNNDSKMQTGINFSINRALFAL